MDIPKMGIVFHAARAELIEREPNVSDETLRWFNEAMQAMFDLGVSIATEKAAKQQGGA